MFDGGLIRRESVLLLIWESASRTFYRLHSRSKAAWNSQVQGRHLLETSWGKKKCFSHWCCCKSVGLKPNTIFIRFFPYVVSGLAFSLRSSAPFWDSTAARPMSMWTDWQFFLFFHSPTPVLGCHAAQSLTAAISTEKQQALWQRLDAAAARGRPQMSWQVGPYFNRGQRLDFLAGQC